MKVVLMKVDEGNLVEQEYIAKAVKAADNLLAIDIADIGWRTFEQGKHYISATITE